MLGYLIFAVCLVAALLLAGRWFLSADPKLLAKVVRYAGLGGLGLLAAFFLLTGRWTAAIVPGIGAYMFWRALQGRSMGGASPGGGWGGFGGGWGGGNRSGSGESARHSDVKTDYLHMTLTHETGEMDGEVVQGRFAGRALSGMSLESLIMLLDECRWADPPSVSLLETYMDRAFGAEWREQAGKSAGNGGGRTDAGMSLEEARDILGVDAAASAEEIRAAHHREMLKHHPDRGGSSYMAARINEAKDILLQS